MFQFQIGAIRRVKVIETDKFENMFQFQIGAIRSTWLNSTKEFTITCFNSKLVRLEATSELSDDATFISFNSKLVRLEVNIESIGELG